jgi:hypothetical protein
VWLGRIGDAVVAFVFVLGSTAGFALGFKQNHFVASDGQLLGAAVLSVLLIVCAFLIPARRLGVMDSREPHPWIANPWITGAIAFLLGVGVMETPFRWGWGAVGAMLAIDVVFLVLVLLFSRRAGWSALHVLSLAAGGALAYGIHAFTAKPLLGGVVGMRISNTVFVAAAVGLIWLGERRIRRYQRPA